MELNLNMDSIKVAELLTSPMFKCIKCDKRLSIPIMSVPNLGNICGRCYRDKPYTNASENSDITDILSKLVIPCYYTKQGCFFQGPFSDTSKHEEVCSFRDKTCPFSYLDKCKNISISSISRHMKTEHVQHVHPYNSNSIKIDLSLKMDFEDFHLLVLNEENYLLRIKLDCKQEFLYFLIYYFENSENNFYIGHESEDICIKSVLCNVVPDAFLASNFEVKCATKFDVSILKKCFNTDIRTVITISMPTFLISNSKMLKFMECPVCNEYMNVQIQQCSQGHSICKMCRQKLQECPLCKSGFGSARNYTLESLCSLIYFPCKNNGCTKYISGYEIEKHELDCKYKHYKCPFLIKLNCKWKGLYENMLDHLISDHSQFTEFHDFVERRITLDYVNHKYDTICIVLGQYIFKVCVCINGSSKLFLTYGLYGPATTRDTFFWETGIYHKNSDKHKFVVRDMCSTYTTTNYTLNVEGYGVEDTIYFYHKVTQKYL